MAEPVRSELTADHPFHASPLGRWDLFCVSLVVALMAVFWYVRARHRIFWGDELAAAVLMRETSFSQMIHDWRASVDSGSLFFEAVGWLWVRIFSHSELAQRGFSAAGVATSFVLLWITARRFYSVGIVVICLPITFFLNETLRWQLYNGRMYGGFMAAMALVVFAFGRATPRFRLTPSVLVLTFFAHLWLMSSHILGPLYSGAFITGLVVQDLWVKQFRPALYFSALAGWMIFPITFANIRNTAALSKVGYFTVTPHLRDLLSGSAVYSRTTFEILAVLAMAAALAWFFLPNGRLTHEELSARKPVYFVLLTFAAILLTSFITSRFATSIFYNRYLLPICLGDALLMCELLDRVAQELLSSTALRYAGLTAGVLCALGVYGVELHNPFPIPEPDFTEGLLAKVPPGVPLVITDVELFSQMELYRGDHAMIVNPLDWSVALDPDAGPGGAAGSVFMMRWRDAGIYSDRILSSIQVLARFPEFVVVNLPEHNLWFRRYVRSNPRYEILPEGTYHKDDVWLVRTRNSAQTVAPPTALPQ